ncbi:MAG TPA: winged helix-turn-helix domain-containing protein [Pyrinomonadaceae bacterium]|nr:winged helix-turn-helix domain-containing protein [Pyrinomonadaceae bacterium]
MDNAKLQQTRELYCFNGFRLDNAERRLWFADEPIPLKPKQFDLLVYFVRNAGRVATKDELLNAIWAKTFVEETTLARNVSWLRNALGKYVDGDAIIETVPKLGYRFTPPVTISEPDEDTIIIEKQTFQYFRGEETITIEDNFAEKREELRNAEREEKELSKTSTSSFLPFSLSPFLVAAFALVALVGSGTFLYRNYFNIGATANSLNDNKNKSVRNIPAGVNLIKIGSIVHLQNRYPNDGSYLDAWGAVWSKPEFKQIPTETMFVSTHNNPNRDNGSGSWEIVSANGKSKGESLAVGDRIHLKNMYPNAGYLDACGWIEHLPVFEKFSDQTGAVFTTKTPNRDNGTGVWIIRSATEADGTQVLEGDSIAIESSYFINDRGINRVAGFLNVAGKVQDIPSFIDYNGSKLVFTQNISFNQNIIDIWTITKSKAVLE